MHRRWCWSPPGLGRRALSTTRCSRSPPAPNRLWRREAIQGVIDMSSHPSQIAITADASRLPVTLATITERKRLGEPLVMVTAYDFPSARAAEAAGVDIVLVGDSGAMTVLGYPSTVGVSVEEMIMLTRAVRRGLHSPFLVADLPFGSYEE